VSTLRHFGATRRAVEPVADADDAQPLYPPSCLPRSRSCRRLHFRRSELVSGRMAAPTKKPAPKRSWWYDKKHVVHCYPSPRDDCHYHIVAVPPTSDIYDAELGRATKRINGILEELADATLQVNAILDFVSEGQDPARSPSRSGWKHASSHRRPVYSGNRRVPGLYERTLADGSTVYDAALRLGGQVRRRRLQARTKTDAISELRALQVDYVRGEAHRSPAEALTLEELARDYITHLRARINETDPRRRRSPRTVEHYEAQLRLHMLPLLGRRPAVELTIADVRRLRTAHGTPSQIPRMAAELYCQRMELTV
jgi:hypothetical protein